MYQHLADQRLTDEEFKSDFMKLKEMLKIKL